MFRRVAGRPVLPRTDRAARRRRMMSRCQRRIVSGVTSRRRPWRRAFGITPSSTARSARSAQFRFGRRGCCRCKSASWWRRIKISAVFHVCSRRDSCSHAASRVIRRNTNRRHMIGDHHRRRAERATPLVRAVDAILGTHRGSAPRCPSRSGSGPRTALAAGGEPGTGELAAPRVGGVVADNASPEPWSGCRCPARDRTRCW